MHPVFYREEGKGPVLVLLHGFCETNEIWANLNDSLSQSFKLLIPDLPGFGKSGLPPNGFSISQIGSILWKWLDEHNVQKPVIIGHSLGGYVTLAMMEERPDQATGFGLFNSTANPDTPEKKENRNKVIDFVSKNGALPFIDTLVPGLFYRKDHAAIATVLAIARQSPKETVMQYSAAMRDRPDRTGLLKTCEKPVLIVAGDRDEIVPVSSLEEQFKMLKNGHFKVLPETGHMGMYEATAESANAIAQFVSLCQR